MFSPRTFAIFALLAVAAAGPVGPAGPAAPTAAPADDPTLDVDDSFPWNFPFGGFASLKNFFNPFLKWFPILEEIGPRVETTEDNFRVIIGAKSYKKDDIEVKVRGDYIVVKGSHEAKRDEHDLFASQFINTYSLPANASAAAVTATLTSDGFLVVDAPIGEQTGEPAPAERVVPIVESGKPLEEQTTTPAADREEVTEANEIPHGTEPDLAP